MAAQNDTQPIDLASGRPRAFKRREVTREVTPDPDHPDPDAPKTSSDKTGSGLVRNFVDTVLTTAKNPNPSEADLRKLNVEVNALAMLAERGLGLLAAGGGGGGRSKVVTLLAVIAAALGLNIGADAFGLGSSDAQAQAVAEAKVQSERAAQDVVELRKRQDAAEALETERDRVTRYQLGLTVRWLGDEQERHCKNNQAIAEGVNWLVKRELARRGDDDESVGTIKIDCNGAKLIPPELEILRATARSAE